MRNRIILISMALLMLAGAVFAGGGSESAPVSEPQFSDIDLSGVEVLFWHQHSRARGEAMDKIIADFNATNPYGITVVGEYAGGYGDIYSKMINGIAGGVVPNLVVGYQNQAGAYMLADGLVDIEPYVLDPEYGLTAEEKADYIEGIYNSDYNAQFDNKRLGFAPNRSMEVLYYNADWLAELGYDAPPTTWEEFKEMAIAATDEAAGTYGYAISTDASNVFAMAISRGGDGFLNDDAEYDFSSDAIADSFAAIKELYDVGAAHKIAEAYGDQTDFGNGKVLFTMGSTSGLYYYGAAVDSNENGAFEWSVAPIPHTTSTPVMDMYGASVSIPQTTPEQQLAAWIFIKYLTSPEPQAEWAAASGYFPVRQSARDMLSDYLAENPVYATAFDILLNSDVKTEPPFASYEEVRRVVASTYEEILDGTDIQEALADLTEEANYINEDMLP